jgi:hypothetical protein
MFGMPANLRLASLLVPMLLLAACSAKTSVTTPQGETGEAPRHVRVYESVDGTGGQFTAIRSTPDGGYLALGLTEDFELNSDVLVVVKTRADGSLQWQRKLGAIGNPDLYVESRSSALVVMADGGCLVSGTLFGMARVLRLDAEGGVVWQWGYGATSSVTSMQLAPSGHVLVTGVNASLVSEDTTRVWVVRLNADGSEPRGRADEWQMAEAGANEFHHNGQLVSLEDGGFLVAGSYETAQGQMTMPYAARVNSQGVTSWKYVYDPGASFASAKRINGGFVLAGFDGGAVQLTELSDAGAVIRQLRYPLPFSEGPVSNSAKAVSMYIMDDAYVVATSYDAVEAPQRETNAWVFKAARNDGAVLWQYRYGAADLTTRPWSIGGINTAAFDLDMTSDGDFRVAGRFAHSVPSWGLGGGMFSYEAWILEMSPSGTIATNERSALSSVPTTVAVTSALPVTPVAFGSTEVFARHAGGEPAVQLASGEINFRIETQTGATGVLQPPSTGTNSQGNTFYWTHVPEAAGYILFYSPDGQNYLRHSTWISSGEDLRHAPGYYRLASFNASGYSAYSSVQRIEADETEDTGRTLRFRVTGRGVVRVGSAIECTESSSAAACSERFLVDTQLTATATAIDDQIFEGWSGDCALNGLQQRITVVLDRDIECEARFSAPSDTVTLTVIVENDATAQVVSEPAGIVCSMAPSSDCTQQLSPGSRLLLTATPFPPTLTWEGCDRVVAIRFCEVQVNSSRTVRARY